MHAKGYKTIAYIQHVYPIYNGKAHTLQHWSHSHLWDHLTHLSILLSFSKCVSLQTNFQEKQLREFLLTSFFSFFTESTNSSRTCQKGSASVGKTFVGAKNNLISYGVTKKILNLHNREQQWHYLLENATKLSRFSHHGYHTYSFLKGGDLFLFFKRTKQSTNDVIAASYQLVSQLKENFIKLIHKTSWHT